MRFGFVYLPFISSIYFSDHCKTTLLGVVLFCILVIHLFVFALVQHICYCISVMEIKQQKAYKKYGRNKVDKAVKEGRLKRIIKEKKYKIIYYESKDLKKI